MRLIGKDGADSKVGIEGRKWRENKTTKGMLRKVDTEADVMDFFFTHFRI